MSVLAVLGNISRDVAVYPGGRRFEILGGAALHLARAATQAGLASAPVSVIGGDLGWIRADPRLAKIDLSRVKVADGQSCTFTLTYIRGGELASTDCSFGVAESLTAHCLATVGHHRWYHVCCRRPLGVHAVLSHLARAGLTFSTDFHLASAGKLIDEALTFLPHARVTFVNAAEFTTLATLTNPARLPACVISNGPREVTIIRHGTTTAVIRPPTVSPVEVTGAGDTLAGTFLAGMACGLSDGDALQAAVDSAAQWIQSPGLVINATRHRS